MRKLLRLSAIVCVVVILACKHADEGVPVTVFTGRDGKTTLDDADPGEYVSSSPIKAVFEPATFTTTYTVDAGLKGIRHEIESYELKFHWSRPNCGTSEKKGTTEVPAYLDELRSSFVWVHPHPPCGKTTDHKDVIVTVLIGSNDDMLAAGFTPKDFATITVCQFVGSATGQGSACTKTTYRDILPELKPK